MESDSQSLISISLLNSLVFWSLNFHVVVSLPSQLTELRWFTWEPVMVSLGNRLTSCACLSLQANIGQMDTAKDKWKMIMGNLALIQVPYTLRVFAHYFCCNGSSRVVEVRSLKMPCVCMFLARTVPIYFYNCVMKLRKGILLLPWCIPHKIQ